MTLWCALAMAGTMIVALAARFGFIHKHRRVPEHMHPQLHARSLSIYDGFLADKKEGRAGIIDNMIVSPRYEGLSSILWMKYCPTNRSITQFSFSDIITELDSSERTDCADAFIEYVVYLKVCDYG